MVLKEHGGDESQVIHHCKGGTAVPPPRSIITAEKEIDLNKIYDQKDNLSIFKPIGLWYAIGDSWYKYWYKNLLPKNLNIFKLSIRKNSFTTDLKNPDPNKITWIRITER